MPDPLQIAQIAALGIGGIGDLFYDSPNEKYIDELLGEYRKLSKEGVGVGKLVAPQIASINQSEERTISDQNRKLNQAGLANTSVATQAPLGVRETFAAKKGVAFRSAEARNEMIKQRARRMIPQLLGMRPDLSEGFGNLAAAGTSGLLRGTLNSNMTNRQSEIAESAIDPKRILGKAGVVSSPQQSVFEDIYKRQPSYY